MLQPNIDNSFSTIHQDKARVAQRSLEGNSFSSLIKFIQSYLGRNQTSVTSASMLDVLPLAACKCAKLRRSSLIAASKPGLRGCVPDPDGVDWAAWFSDQ